MVVDLYSDTESIVSRDQPLCSSALWDMRIHSLCNIAYLWHL